MENNMQAAPAEISGQAARTPRADPPPLTHADFAAGNAVLHATVHITRADTGKVDTFQITGTPE